MMMIMMMGCGVDFPNTLLNGRIGSVETLVFTAEN